MKTSYHYSFLPPTTPRGDFLARPGYATEMHLAFSKEVKSGIIGSVVLGLPAEDETMELPSMLFNEWWKLFLGPLISLHWRLRTEGEGNVPESGPGIVVANHRCYIDPVLIAYAIDRYINFAAGSHLYKVPGASEVFKLFGFFKMYIYGGEEGDKSLDEASHLLSRGELIGIFPEGIESFMDVFTVSKIATFKTGFAKIALENRAPIIPVALVPQEELTFPHVPGTFITPFVTHPRAKDGITLITYRKVTLRIGIPIDLSPYYDEVFSKNLIDHIAMKVRRIIINMYDGNELDKFITGETPYDFVNDTI